MFSNDPNCRTEVKKFDTSASRGAFYSLGFAFTGVSPRVGAKGRPEPISLVFKKDLFLFVNFRVSGEAPFFENLGFVVG